MSRLGCLLLRLLPQPRCCRQAALSPKRLVMIVVVVASVCRALRHSGAFRRECRKLARGSRRARAERVLGRVQATRMLVDSGRKVTRSTENGSGVKRVGFQRVGDRSLAWSVGWSAGQGGGVNL